MPAREEFFAHESLRTFDGLTQLERANKLVELFKRNTHEDPDYEPWQKGLAFSEQWLALLQSEDLTEQIVMALVRDVSLYSRRNCDSLWSVLHLGVSRCAYQLGYADQVRAMLRTVD